MVFDALNGQEPPATRQGSTTREKEDFIAAHRHQPVFFTGLPDRVEIEDWFAFLEASRVDHGEGWVVSLLHTLLENSAAGRHSTCKLDGGSLTHGDVVGHTGRQYDMGFSDGRATAEASQRAAIQSGLLHALLRATQRLKAVYLGHRARQGVKRELGASASRIQAWIRRWRSRAEVKWAGQTSLLKHNLPNRVMLETIVAGLGRDAATGRVTLQEGASLLRRLLVLPAATTTIPLDHKEVADLVALEDHAIVNMLMLACSADQARAAKFQFRPNVTKYRLTLKC